MKIVKSLNIDFGCFLIIAILSLAARFRLGEAVYFWGDIAPWMVTNDSYFDDVGLWNNQNGGGPNNLGGWLIGWLGNYVCRAFGLSGGLIDGLAYALPFAAGGSGISRLAGTLGLGSVPRILAATHYAFALDWGLTAGDSAVVSRAVFPWLMISVHTVNRHLGQRSGKWPAFVFSCLAVTYASLASSNAPQVIVCAAALFVWLLLTSAYELIIKGDRIIRLKQIAIQWLHITIYVFLLGGWLIVWYLFVWLFPILGLGGAQVDAPTSVGAWSFVHSQSSFQNLVIGLGFWAWLEAYFPIFTLVNNMGGRVLVGIPFWLSLCAIFFNNKITTRVATIIILSVLFIMKGIHEPFGAMFRVLFEWVPGMTLLREPIGKLSFLWLLLSSLLLAVSMDGLGRRCSPGVSLYNLALVVVCCSIGFTYFLSMRELRDQGTAVMPARWVEIPSDWVSMRAFTTDEAASTHGRTIVLPPNEGYTVAYAWGAYAVDTLPARFLRLNQIQHVNGYFTANPQSSRAAMALYGKLSEPVVECDGFRDRAVALDVRSALIRYDLSSKTVMPLGSGPALIYEASRLRRVLRGCGWKVAYHNPSLEFLTAPGDYASAPVPLGRTGESVFVSANGPSRRASDAGLGMVGELLVRDGALETNFSAGYGFALVECIGVDLCDRMSAVRGWFVGRIVWCAPQGYGQWCRFPIDVLHQATYQVRNLWEDVYLALLILSIGSLGFILTNELFNRYKTHINQKRVV